MARARGGGATGYAVALAFFAAGFLICLLLAIIFYTQVSGARSEAEQAQADLRDVVSPNELQSGDVAPLRDGQGTVVGQLLEQVRSAQSQINQLNSQITTLQAELSAARGAVEDAQSAQAAAEQQARQYQQQAAQAREQFAQATSRVEGQVNQVTQQATTQAQRLQQAQQNIQQELQGVTQRFASQVQERENQISTLETQIREMQGRLADLREQQAQLAPRTDPDGRIVSVSEGDNTVYINVGRADRVIPGMTFEVFSSGQLIKLDEFDELRGEGTIEVVTVNDNSSLARIVRRDRGSNITEGDVIANVAYDVNSTPKFYVFGNFNIDGNATNSQNDQQRIESMITRWGGRVVQELTPDVDYLVLGQRPEAPEQLPPNITNPEVIARNVEQTRQYETYLNLVGEARTLNIPVLNQNRFLSLIGYYQR